jgi:hypothetical protein
MPAAAGDPSTRRRVLTTLAMAVTGATAAMLAACRAETPATDGKTGGPKMDKDVVYLDVSLFSYLSRPIFDVLVNGIDIGVAGPFGGGALMTGVAVPLGPQVVTWRDAGTGEQFKAGNQPILTRPDRKLTYLGVHIYPDSTVEFVPGEFWPERTERGEAIAREQAGKHVK